MTRTIRLRAPQDRPAELSDASIAYACASGDPEAVGELFDRFQLPVTRFLGRILVAPTDVEDVLQKTFVELARGAARYRGRSSVRSWLFGIAANMARQHIRAEVRRRRILEAARWIGFDHEDGDARASARADLRAVQDSLAFLSVKQRLAFVLCEIEGFTAREASRMLSTSETAVWRRVSDARRQILTRLGEER